MRRYFRRQLEGTFRGLVLQDALDDEIHPRVSGPQTQVGQEGQFVERLPGAFVAGDHFSGPAGQLGNEAFDTGICLQRQARGAHLGVAFCLAEQVQAGAVGDPGFTF